MLLFVLFIPAIAAGQNGKWERYDRYEGTIAHRPVVMNLRFNSGRVTGSYYYAKIGAIIQLGSEYSEVKTNSELHQINLDEWYFGDTSSVSNRLELTLSDDRSLNGAWKAGDGSKSEPVELHIAYPPGSVRLAFFSVSDSAVKRISAHEQISALTTNDFLLAIDSNSSNGQFIDSQISNYIGDSGKSKEIRHFALSTSHEYVTQTLNEIDTEIMDLDDSERTEGWPDRFQYFSDNNFSVLFNDADILVLKEEFSEYSGGAHESYAAKLHVLDLATKRELTLSDVTSADSATLDPLLEKYFRIQYKLRLTEPLSKVLFENSLTAGQNFFLTNHGITFFYNPYEIASWAQGAIQVFVPYSALKGKLAPWLVKRFKL